jgi:hypothetical protein
MATLKKYPKIDSGYDGSSYFLYSGVSKREKKSRPPPPKDEGVQDNNKTAP